MDELPESAYMHLLALQKSLTLEVAATASTVAQVTKTHGEPTVTKLVCAIVKLFNDGLNTSEKMRPRQLFECAQIWIDAFPHETLKDLILCLKRVKAGRYGPIFNRVDSTVINGFFCQYLEDKADWLADAHTRLRAELSKQAPAVLDVLDEPQKKAISNMTRKVSELKTPDMGVYKSDATYTRFIGEHAEEIAFDDLVYVKKRAKAQNNEEAYDIATKEINRRATKIDQDYKDYANGTETT